MNHPGWILVKSAAIEAVAYDSTNSELLIRFVGGREYAYTNVTASEHTALVTAGSIGKCFNQTIKTAKPFRKLESV